jgi:hypothetical protein
VGEHTNEEGYRDGKNHKQPNVIEDSDQFSVGHTEGNILFPLVLDHQVTAKFKIDFRLFAIFEVGLARRKAAKTSRT